MSVMLGFPGHVHGDRKSAIDKIRARLAESGTTLSDAIAERDLYFRLSVVGTCNLSCSFCHNEGAPNSGKIHIDLAERAIIAAKAVGFTRVQFTGGEPLLRPDIGDFVRAARRHVGDVGVTTNGTYLEQRIAALVASGITRIHVSLQTQSLEEAGSRDKWGVPPWLAPAIDLAAQGNFLLRLNLPVPANRISHAEEFVTDLIAQGISIKVFSVLPEGSTPRGSYPLEDLTKAVQRSNDSVLGSQNTGTASVRGFKPPTGIRCTNCVERARCMEQSHSLRLGADGILRPCLATRQWDQALGSEGEMVDDIEAASILAIDYVW